MLIEKAFLDFEGFGPLRELLRHLVTSPPAHSDKGSSTSFPTVRDLVFQLQNDKPDEAEKFNKMKKDLEIAITKTALAIDKATSIVKLL